MELTKDDSTKSVLDTKKKSSRKTLTGQAARGASWLAVFNTLSQIISWSNTILIARILTPSDYGLKTMATMLTGYILMFNELGLGRAIVQRPEPTKNELSSVFWFTVITSFSMMIIAMIVAFPTALIFKNNSLIPITIVSSFGFILQGVQIVPRNLLHRDLKFKDLGMMHLISGTVSSCLMLLLAWLGFGVWTLVFGNIIIGFTNIINLLIVQKWRPNLYFKFKEAREYIKYGLTIAVGSTFHYVLEMSDRFVAAKAWNATKLGYYTFAIELARLPLFKIVTLINQVSFPVFARLQGNKEETREFYLNVTKVTALLVFPLFFGGFLIGEDLVAAILDSKWLPVVYFFKYLCLAQLIVSVNAINGFVHNAQGRPIWNTVFVAIEAVVMPLSFYAVIGLGERYFVLPWFTSYLLLNTIFLIKTLKVIEISMFRYVKTLSSPLIAIFVMLVAVTIIKELPSLQNYNKWVDLFCKIGSGGIGYLGFLYIADRDFLKKMRKIMSK